MTLIKFRNNPIADRYTGFPTVFGDFFNDFFNDELLPKDAFRSVPAVNIIETPERFHIELAAPGMNKADFKVEVENGVLTIRAERKEEKKEEDSKFTRKEFSYSSFRRSFTMPEHVDAEQIQAEYNNGVLSINLPKRVEEKKKAGREITVA